MKIMKKITIIYLLIIATTFNFTACKSDSEKVNAKDASKIEIKKASSAFSVNNATNDIKFIAYKTTDKVGVPGWFKKINVTAGGDGDSVREAINNAEFSIPVSSLHTKDTSRDYKIKKFFFGMMENTELLSGKLMISDQTNGKATIKMNGIIKEIPFTYTIVDKTFSLTSSMDVKDWKATKALSSLNKVCELLHTGSDGISKTWSEVSLNITSTF